MFIVPPVRNYRVTLVNVKLNLYSAYAKSRDSSSIYAAISYVSYPAPVYNSWITVGQQLRNSRSRVWGRKETARGLLGAILEKKVCANFDSICEIAQSEG